MYGVQRYPSSFWKNQHVYVCHLYWRNSTFLQKCRVNSRDGHWSISHKRIYRIIWGWKKKVKHAIASDLWWLRRWVTIAPTDTVNTILCLLPDLQPSLKDDSIALLVLNRPWNISAYNQKNQSIVDQQYSSLWERQYCYLVISEALKISA